MILVALPLAAAMKASRALMVSTPWPGAASLIRRMASAVACWTFRMASASASASRILACLAPSAWRIAACLAASARRMADCFSPSATRIWDCFWPSAWRMDSRRSRSARICFSIDSWMSRGGMMFFSSTRLTLIPQGSVASSRRARILVLMWSRLVRVWSSSRSPMMLRRVVAVRFSMADMGFSIP